MSKLITKPLGEIGTYINGRAFKPEDWKTSGVPIIRIENLNNPKAIFNYYQGEIEEKYRVDNGDILVSWSASLDAYVWNSGPAVLNQHIFKIVPNEKLVDKDFLFFILKRAMKGLSDLVHGATMKHVNRPVFEAFEVVFPKDRECQKRLATSIKKRLDEVEEAKKAVIIQKQEIKQLKNFIRREAFRTIENKWGRNHSLKEVCTISAGGTPSRGSLSYFTGEIPWVKTLDLNLGLVTETQEKISQDAFKSIRGEMLSKGTVLVAMYGGAGTIGKSGILGIEACTNQAICALQPKPSLLSSQFLHEWLCFIRPEWMQHSSGNRKDPNINKSVVEEMTIPLPPLEDQIVFITTITEALAKAQDMECAIISQYEEVTLLAKKLIEGAFNEIKYE